MRSSQASPLSARSAPTASGASDSSRGTDILMVDPVTASADVAVAGHTAVHHDGVDVDPLSPSGDPAVPLLAESDSDKALGPVIIRPTPADADYQ